VHHPCLHLFSLKWLINFGFHTSQHPSTSFNYNRFLHKSHPILLDELQVLALRLDDVLLPGLRGMALLDRPWELSKFGKTHGRILGYRGSVWGKRGTLNIDPG
jgi:hypothetical protein